MSRHGAGALALRPLLSTARAAWAVLLACVLACSGALAPTAAAATAWAAEADVTVTYQVTWMNGDEKFATGEITVASDASQDDIEKALEKVQPSDEPDPPDNKSEFAGWSAEKPDKDKGTVVVNAQWKPIEYTVTWYDGYSGAVVQTLEGITDISAKNLSKLHPAEKPEREGYTFEMWVIGTADREKKTLAVTAQWKEPVAPELTSLTLYYVPQSAGDNPDPDKWPQVCNKDYQPYIDEALGYVSLMAESTFSTGNIGWVEDTGVTVRYAIEEFQDPKGNPIETELATVETNTGKVEALGNGNGYAKVSCTASNTSVETTCLVKITGNSDTPYVVKLELCDENGTPFADDQTVDIPTSDYTLGRYFYANITYKNPLTGEEYVVRAGGVDSNEPNVYFNISNEEIATVNQKTGLILPKAGGTLKLRVTVRGGKKDGTNATDTVFVLIGGDAVDSRFYVPADTLSVKVVYAKLDDKGKPEKDANGKDIYYDVGDPVTFTPSQLEALGAHNQAYTLIRDNSSGFAINSAYGVDLDTILSSIKGGIAVDDVWGFYFNTTDNYKTGTFMGAGWLFQTRYWYPNYSLGGSIVGAEVAKPMIALRSSVEDGTDIPDFDNASEMTRFRLCFGAENNETSNSALSMYNIHTMTVVLEKAPSAGFDEETTGPQPAAPEETGKPDKPDEPEKPEKPKPSVPAGGASSDKPTGSDGGTGPSLTGGLNRPLTGGSHNIDGDDAGGPSGAGPNTSAPADVGSAESEVASTSPQNTVEVSLAGGAGEAEAQVEEDTTPLQENQPKPQREEAENSQYRWQVYQMINNPESAIDPVLIDNPLEPFLVPTLLVLGLGGAAGYLVRWRRLLAAPLVFTPVAAA